MIFFVSINLLLCFLFTLYFIPSKKDKKPFLFFFSFIIVILTITYKFKGDKNAFTFSENLENEIKTSEVLEPKKIILFLEKKVKDNPYDIKGWEILARTCLIAGYTQKANLYYKKGISYFPNDKELLTEYAIFKRRTNDINTSIKIVEKIGKLYPNDSDNLILLVRLYIENKEFEKAKKKIETLSLIINDTEIIEELNKLIIF